MNERAVTPAPPSPPRPPARTQSAVTGRDREFLPAALEILESPPPPIPVVTMLTICAFFAALLVWSYFGKLDVHAVAQGKIERAGRTKVLQPLDPGKVSAIHVAAGDRVKAGDVVFELDPAETLADASTQRDAEFSGLAEVARRRTENTAVQRLQVELTKGIGGDARADLLAIAGNPGSRVVWDRNIPELIRVREGAVLSADLFQLLDSLQNIDKQQAQKDATLQRLKMSIAFQDNLIDTLTARVGTRQKALDLAVGTKINLYDAKEELQKSQAALASDQGQLIETDAAQKELESEKLKTVSTFVADNENKLVEAARKGDEAHQLALKAEARLARTKLTAPIDGYVQQISVTTIGQVVTTGQELAVITPSEGPLQVEALVANLDIGFVKPGQEVAIKVDAFPFTRFGVVRGKVEKIATEAVDESAAKRTLVDATATGSPNVSPTASGPGQAQNFVFPVTISLDKTAINIDGQSTPLSPGMTVTAEIRTDSRRVIDYIFSPLSKVASEALRER
jgi:hemolysin D